MNKSSIVLLLSLGSILVLVLTFPNTTLPKQKMFQIGDCVHYDFELESWEKPSLIYRIENIGKKSYQCSALFGDEWVLSPLNLSFTTNMKKVKCPKGIN